MSGPAPRHWNAAGALLALGLALAVTAGCAKHAAPTAPRAQLPPQVVATSPPARALHVPTEAAIWAEFDRPLDPSTVDTRHVFLKIDTRRLPITVSYDAAHRRVVIDAGGELALFATHTVEFRPGLRTADGDSLGQTYFWQFTTLGVRLPRAPYPEEGATGESPFAELLWQGTETTAGPIFYDLFTGADSGAVAARTSASTRVAAAQYLPGAKWPQDTPFFWSVRANNQNTGDQSDGPVWRFEPLPTSTPVDSMVVRPSNWLYGTLRSTSPNYIYNASCKSSIILVDASYDNLETWDFSALGPGLRLAGSALVVSPTAFFADGQTHGLTLWSARSLGTICVLNAAAPLDLPERGPLLSAAEVIPGKRLRFQSDALSTFAESVVRHGNLDGTVFSSASRIDLQTLTPPLALTLYVYRTGPRPAVAARR
jgi:hypothetical protein